MKHRLPLIAFAGVVTLNVLVVYAPSAPGGPGIPQLDKLVHLLAFALVAWTGRLAGVAVRWLLPLLLVHAVASELVQHFLLPHRSGDPWDVVADCIGVALGMLAPVGRARLPVRENMSP